MTYDEWNLVLFEHFFSVSNAGNDVYLYLSTDELVELGKERLPGKSDAEILKDYMRAISLKKVKDVPLVKDLSLIDEPVRRHKRWDKRDIPPYIAYLVLFIMPLTEEDTGKFGSGNYYGRVNAFFKKHGILKGTQGQEIGTTNFQHITPLWKALEKWSTTTRHGELGIFKIREFGNSQWKNVGNPLSQCLLRPKAMRKLKEVFLIAGFVPYRHYTRDDFRQAMLKVGISQLQLHDNVKKLIVDESNELGDSILEIVQRQYERWSGESHVAATRTAKATKGFTVAPLLLQFVINQQREEILFTYRMFSKNVYPDDLKLDTFENIYQSRGWSKSLKKTFNTAFELTDLHNKWIARFPRKSVRIFVDGSVHQLSNEYWVETESLSKIHRMYLLCEHAVEESIMQWGAHFPPGVFKREEYDGMPEDYALFSFKRPTQDHPDIAVLKVPSDKTLSLVDGLHIGHRRFLDTLLPKVEVMHGDGDEKVFIQYGTGERIQLQQQHPGSGRWEIGADVRLNTDFFISIDGVEQNGYQKNYVIVTADHASAQCREDDIPCRDSAGSITNARQGPYTRGVDVFNIDHRAAQTIYQSLFTSVQEDTTLERRYDAYNSVGGNVVLSFLTLKKVTTTEEFYTAVEYLQDNALINQQHDFSFNHSASKRTAMHYYDAMGFVDFDSRRKKLVICPPRLLLMPTERGRTALLTGARDPAFMTKVLLTARKFDLSVHISPQHESIKHLLLPDVVIIRAFGSRAEQYGMRRLIDFSQDLQIKFAGSDALIQPALLELAASLEDYKTSVLSGHEVANEEHGWSQKIFDITTLRYVNPTENDGSTGLSLVEYKLNEYTREYRLWVDGKCYAVTGSWGKYWVLQHYHKDVILHDEATQQVGIPLHVPLPKWFAKTLVLVSGRAPILLYITEGGITITYKVYDNVPGIFIKNLGKKIGQLVRPYNLKRS